MTSYSAVAPKMLEMLSLDRVTRHVFLWGLASLVFRNTPCTVKKLPLSNYLQFKNNLKNVNNLHLRLNFTGATLIVVSVGIFIYGGSRMMVWQLPTGNQEVKKIQCYQLEIRKHFCKHVDQMV